MDALTGSVEFAFSPVGILVLLFAAGILLSIVRPGSGKGRGLLMLGAVLFLLFYFSPLAEILIGGLERRYPTPADPEAAEIEFIAVLSGYGEDHPAFPATSNLSGETLCRLSEGIRLHRRFPQSKLILSGGVLREGDRAVAELMADFTKEMGVPAEAIVVEGLSRNTYENLAEVKKIVGTKAFLLVTSACDLRRAMAVAHKLEMKAVAAPSCIWTLQNYPANLQWAEWSRKVAEGFAHPSEKRFTYLQWAFHEYVGYVWYRLLGRI